MSLQPFSALPSLADAVFSDRFSRIDKLFSQLTGDSPVTAAPAYDLQRFEPHRYALTISVPGWKEQELEIELRGGRLSVSGHREKESQETSGDSRQEEQSWLHRGIARHDFQLSFSIPEHMKVTGATLAEGLLNIDLYQEIPESEKPRRIPIVTDGSRTLEHQ